MKKALVLSLLCGIALAAAAQPARHLPREGFRLRLAERAALKSGFGYKLDEFRATDNHQICAFSYDGRSRLLATTDSLAGEYMVIDTLTYDDLGHLVRLSGWQRLSGTFRNVYYIDYTYDEDGNLASRTNYNLFGSEWSLGGVYNYYYNDSHQITRATLTMGGTLFQRVEYQYADGRLAVERWYGYNGDGLALDEVVRYAYNDGGQLINRRDSVLEDGRWTLFALRTYEYDAAGNCTKNEATDAHGDVTERSEYVYDYSRRLAEVLMPWTPEQVRPDTYQNQNPCLTETVYQLDVEHRLQHYCDYAYSYSDYHAAVESLQAVPVFLAPNPAAGRVAVEGLGSASERLQVIDPQGRVVLDIWVSDAANTVDVSSLATGLYVFRLSGRSAKLMVQ